MATIKYEEALHQIEEIVNRLEKDELDIDSLCSELKRAQRLIKFCKDKLVRTDNEVKNILHSQKDSQ